MAKINAIIVEDEPKAADILIRYIEEIEHLNLLKTFRNPVKALEFINSNPVDLIFLDINMPKVSGIEFLNALKHDPLIVFTTAYSEYAVESYKYEALDYLLKPIEFSRFMQTITKVLKKLNHDSVKSINQRDNKRKETILIKSGPQTHQVNVHEILFLEKDGNYITVHVPNKKILWRENMKNIYDHFNPYQFIRVHKSFVVNRDQINVIEVDNISIDKHSIPIGRTYREQLHEILDSKH